MIFQAKTLFWKVLYQHIHHLRLDVKLNNLLCFGFGWLKFLTYFKSLFYSLETYFVWLSFHFISSLYLLCSSKFFVLLHSSMRNCQIQILMGITFLLLIQGSYVWYGKIFFIFHQLMSFHCTFDRLPIVSLRILSKIYSHQFLKHLSSKRLWDEPLSWTHISKSHCQLECKWVWIFLEE